MVYGVYSFLSEASWSIPGVNRYDNIKWIFCAEKNGRNTPNPNVIFSLALGTENPNTTPSQQSHEEEQKQNNRYGKIKRSQENFKFKNHKWTEEKNAEVKKRKAEIKSKKDDKKDKIHCTGHQKQVYWNGKKEKPETQSLNRKHIWKTLNA